MITRCSRQVEGNYRDDITALVVFLPSIYSRLSSACGGEDTSTGASTGCGGGDGDSDGAGDGDGDGRGLRLPIVENLKALEVRVVATDVPLIH